MSWNTTELTTSLDSNALVGKKAFDRYYIEKKVGQGGMAWVFRAVDLHEPRYVALKVLLPHLAELEDVRWRFLQEAEIQQTMQHPHSVAMLDVCEEEKLNGILLEWINGENFLDLKKRLHAPLHPHDIVRLMVPILEAVGYAHDNQMVHRDIKLENLMIHWEGDTPNPKVADFGLAKLLDSMEEGPTKTEMAMGTIGYMSPEQVESAKYVDHRADIYSLGVCLYTLATGRRPFSGSTRDQVIAILSQDPPTPQSLNHHIPDSLNDIILRAIAKQADERYQSCGELAQALLAFAQEPHQFATVTEVQTPTSSGDEEHNVSENMPFVRMSRPPELVDLTPASQLDLVAMRGADSALRLPTMEMASMRGGSSSSGMLGDTASSLWGERLQDNSASGGKGKLVAVVAVALLLVVGGLYLGLFRSEKDPGLKPGTKNKIAECKQGTKRACYTGPANTKGNGPCQSGHQICKKGRFGPCLKQVLPKKKELCNGKDDDCDGKVDETFALTKPCKVEFGDCKLPGKRVCDDDGEAVCEMSDEKEPGPGQVFLSFTPNNQSIAVRYKGETHKVKGTTCISLEDEDTKRVRVRIVDRRYYTCRFVLRKRSKKKRWKLRLRRRKKFGFEPSSRYCLR